MTYDKTAYNAAYHKMRMLDPEFRAKKNAATKQWQRDHPVDLRAKNLWHSHRITVEQYEALLAQQHGVCALCGREPRTMRLAVDHDHSCCSGRRGCGKCIRALLCGDCNLGLGKFGDDPARLRAAADYLERAR